MRVGGWEWKVVYRFVHYLNFHDVTGAHFIKKEYVDGEIQYFHEVNFQYGCFLLIKMVIRKDSV